jgi:hypothetical protein
MVAVDRGASQKAAIAAEAFPSSEIFAISCSKSVSAPFCRSLSGHLLSGQATARAHSGIA